MFPYKIQLVQKLLPRDSDQRVEYSNAILRLSGEIEDFSSKLIMSYEDHFLLSGHVNKQNNRFWGTQNPQLIHEAPDFFLWGFLKSKVYVNKPRTIQHHKDNIGHEIEDIQPQMLQDVTTNALKSAESGIANRGHHLADIIFQS
ncbi:hypothetical protein GWI33_016527 [Rhynchophorus ferrugineus]|uniref:Uncharacterized protein n=1 Tax=Rhynchophorus ferrugineus TaxID=354439 RepID=A0A834IB03_RHYFE|nr:hypothetical protein GWI33_016527 [Rhynchophorus ferrugineus]